MQLDTPALLLHVIDFVLFMGSGIVCKSFSIDGEFEHRG